MKPISLILASALLFHNLAGVIYAATVLTAEEVTPEALTLDTFAEIAHRNQKGKPTTDRGYIKHIGSQTFLIRNGLYQQEIAYRDVISVVMGKNSKEVDRFSRDLKKGHTQKQAENRAVMRLQQPLVFSINPVDTAQLRVGLYALVTYSLAIDPVTAFGRITGIGKHGLMIEKGSSNWHVPYESIHSLFVAHRKQDIERFQKTGAAYQLHARITAPDISKKPIEGIIETIKNDTIFVRSRQHRWSMKVPVSAIVQLDVADRTKSGAGEGFGIGLGITGILTLLATRHASKSDDPFAGLAIFAALFYVGPIITGMSTLIGAIFRTTIWVPVPLDRIEWREHQPLAPEGPADL